MADNTNRIAGVANLTVNGTRYALVGELTYSPGTIDRETKAGQDGIHGYSEKPRPPFISGKFRDMGGLSVASFNDMTNVTLSCQLANGKLVVGRNMWTVKPEEVNAEQGEFDVRWEGFAGSVTEN